MTVEERDRLGEALFAWRQLVMRRHANRISWRGYKDLCARHDYIAYGQGWDNP